MTFVFASIEYAYLMPYRDIMHIGMQEPRISSHGSVSVAVNMKAVCDYMASLPCSHAALTPFTSSPLDMCLSVTGVPAHMMPLTFAVFRRGLCSLGIHDVVNIRDHFEDALATHMDGDCATSSWVLNTASSHCTTQTCPHREETAQSAAEAVKCLLSKVAWDVDACLQFTSLLDKCVANTQAEGAYGGDGREGGEWSNIEGRRSTLCAGVSPFVNDRYLKEGIASVSSFLPIMYREYV